MLKKYITALTLGAASLAISASAGAQTTLNVSTWLPPTHVQNSVVWPTWAKWVEDATDGRVKVNIEYTSNNPTQLFQMVEDGVSDAAFSFHGFVPGRFDLQEIVELPGLGVNSEAASVAHWRTYQKYMTESGEHDGLELLALFAHGQGVMQTNFPVRSLDDLKGKKIRIGGGVQAEIGKRLGITPVAAPGNKVYELLQTGVVDGVFMPATEQKAQRLVEVAPHITILPTGMYMGSFVMFINPDFLDSLSKEDAAAIRSVSGEKLSQMAGKSWDIADTEALAYAKENGATVQELTADDSITIAYNEKVKGLDEEWLARVANKGIDAKAALQMLRDEAKAYAATQQ
ncbi:TRAP transporter substrate-binding protein [Pusillimonas sp.]|uniref:TRAP transporter substrate-binding protein n=1 Tax=Pusillimonas sp. TaxID=3040095 RepID=UPI0037C7330C